MEEVQRNRENIRQRDPREELIQTASSVYPDAIATPLSQTAQYLNFSQCIFNDFAGNQIIQYINPSNEFSGIYYSKGAGRMSEKECLEGTREVTIAQILHWAEDVSEDARSVLWLNGQAGSGKSSIVHASARAFSKRGRLASCFCFDASHQAERKPHRVFSTISIDFAHFDKEWKKALASVIEADDSLRTTQSVKVQFEELILKPAAAAQKGTEPILIVIDALDESGDVASRQSLISILGGTASQLPRNIRILLASRLEEDIHNALHGKPHVLSKAMEDIEQASTKSDISLFVRRQLDQVAINLDRLMPNQLWVDDLVEKSDGLFQWASTACKFILGIGSKFLTLRERLNIVLSSRNVGLDGLYHTILAQCAPSPEHPEAWERFNLVMGRILMVREPLTMSDLSKLGSEGQDDDEVMAIVRPLGSLLSGVFDLSKPIRPLHASFRDFLKDASRSKQFHVDTSLQDDKLAHSTLRVMKAGLRFNICGLETSYKRNSEIMDLNTHIEKYIPSHLAYSCRFWPDHVCASDIGVDIVHPLREFMSTRFLFWLETMSLLKTMKTASIAMARLGDWARGCDEALHRIIVEGKAFIDAFIGPILESAAHIYLSALPFTDHESLIYQQYMAMFPNVILVRIDAPSQNHGIHSILEGHTKFVTSVAFSPDGNYIASGSGDGTVRLWDAETNQSIGSPLEGHTNYVQSVTFSPDGKRIVSGSSDNTIRLWDAETGQGISSPLKCHTKPVVSVAFSPDGKYIVSGSADQTIRLWDAETGESVGSPLKGQTGLVLSVACSDGRWIALGSGDGTVRLWDAETRQSIGPPLEGHNESVQSVTFSPGGKRIVSGSSDNTIRLWDAETGQSIGSPLEGHTESVYSVAFSPDGRYIVSGSDDKTVRLWDSQIGQGVGSPLKGHTGSVVSVAFSPDGKHVVSGSGDKTVRLWNAEASQNVGSPLEGQTDSVVSAAFSPDGTRVVSGSSDKSVRLWDAKTGQIIGSPLEGHTKLWDAQIGQSIGSPLEGHTDSVVSVAFSPDGKRVVSGSADKTVKLWNAETGQNVGSPLEGHTKFVTSVAFSPDGKHIASGSGDGTVRLWDAGTGQSISSPLEGHTNYVMLVTFSPDGKYIVSGSWDNTVRLWDAETGQSVGSPFECPNGVGASFAFSPDGKYIVSDLWDNSVSLLDAETGLRIGSAFEGHTDKIYSAAFSPDGKRIVSGSWDGTVRVWDAESRQNIGSSLEGHTSWVNSVAFSLDDKHVASGSWDKGIRSNEPPVLPNKPAFESSSTMKHGWILGDAGELLFWVPKNFDKICLVVNKSGLLVFRTVHI